MNIYLISEYVNRMQKQDVNNFALKQGITLDNEELDIIYNYIKNVFRISMTTNAKFIFSIV